MATAQNNPINYKWSFGTATPDTEAVYNHFVTRAGRYYTSGFNSDNANEIGSLRIFLMRAQRGCSSGAQQEKGVGPGAGHGSVALLR
jgi:hypothetical protein